MIALVVVAIGSRSFGVSLKGVSLHCGVDRILYSRACLASEQPCAMHHWWSGGSFEGYASTRITYRVDNGTAPTVSMQLGPAHGSSPGNDFGTMDENGPWSAGALFGKSGVGLHEGGPHQGSGVFNTIVVPFDTSITVTATLGCPRSYFNPRPFWVILRGHTRASVVLPGGFRLPPSARLRSYDSAAVNLSPSSFLTVVDTALPVTSPSPGKIKRARTAARSLPLDAAHTTPRRQPLAGGAVLFTSLSVTAPAREAPRSPHAAPNPSFQFLEGCLRVAAAAAMGSTNSTSPSREGNTSTSREGNTSTSREGSEWLLSSGTEDYFLGTFYFDKGRARAGEPWRMPAAARTGIDVEAHTCAQRLNLTLNLCMCLRGFGAQAQSPSVQLVRTSNCMHHCKSA